MTGDASLAIIFPMDLINHAPVAQLDRVTGFEPVGREFESLRACQFKLKTSHVDAFVSQRSDFVPIGWIYLFELT